MNSLTHSALPESSLADRAAAAHAGLPVESADYRFAC
jgi:hypothetical protein